MKGWVIKGNEKVKIRNNYDAKNRLKNEINREAKRNAEIHDRKRAIYDLDIDETPEGMLKKALMHEKRRLEKHTKNRWIRMMADYTKTIKRATDDKKKKICDYLESANRMLEDLGNGNEMRTGVRMKNPLLD